MGNELHSGTLVDRRYRLEAPIAHGGMSTVYLATDERLERHVALKLLSPNLANDSSFIQRLRLEAKSVARLSHPGVVQVYDQGVDEGYAFLVMELVPGGTLREVLNERGPMPAHVALSVLRPILGALDDAHRNGLIHRDVKPENILVSHSGAVKLADFGLVRAVAEARSTSQNVVMGTAAYLAPEQIATGETDPRSDLYSLGVVAYELLTGRVPFQGDTPVATAYQRLERDVPPPSTIMPGIPEDLDDLILHATERQLDARVPSAQEFLRRVDAVAMRNGLHSVVVPAPTESAWSRAREHAAAQAKEGEGAGETVFDIASREIARASTSGELAEWNRGETAGIAQPGPTTMSPPDAGPAVGAAGFGAAAGVAGVAGLSDAVAHATTRAVPPHTALQRGADAADIPHNEATAIHHPEGSFGAATTAGSPPLSGSRHPERAATHDTRFLPENNGLPPRSDTPAMEAAPGPHPTSRYLGSPPAAGHASVAPMPRPNTAPAAPSQRRGIGCLVLAIIAILALLLAFGGWWVGSGRLVAIPDTQGMTLSQAGDAITQVGLQFREEPRYHDDIPPQAIVDSDPAAGKRVVPGSTVVLRVSEGSPRVPDLSSSRSRAYVEQALRQRTLRPVSGDTEFSDDVSKGDVVRLSPEPGTRVRVGTEVRLTTSRGPAPTDVPSLHGLNTAGARAALEAAGLRLGRVTREFVPAAKIDTVVRANPDSGARVPRTTPVDIVVSSAADVPDVAGMSLDEARAALEAAGLNVVEGAPESDSRILAGAVIRTEPGAGERIDADQGAVTLIPSDSIRVPFVLGMTVSQATRKLREAGLNVVVETGQSGLVYGQVPLPGNVVGPHAKVTLDALG